MEQKSRVAAGLFGIFLGGVGVHSFYLGYKTKGIWHIVLYVLSVIFACMCIIPYVGWAIYFIVALPLSLGNSIWALVEAITIFAKKDFVDANGNLLS